jgi:hypothetical protein
MPRLVHLPLALEGANKVHLISKIHHIIYETLSISQNSSYSQGWFISDVGNPQCTRNPSVSSISFSTSPRQPSRTQPATSTPEKVGEA